MEQSFEGLEFLGFRTVSRERKKRNEQIELSKSRSIYSRNSVSSRHATILHHHCRLAGRGRLGHRWHESPHGPATWRHVSSVENRDVASRDRLLPLSSRSATRPKTGFSHFSCWFSLYVFGVSIMGLFGTFGFYWPEDSGCYSS
ncbi:hypothetical protein HanIR_Chr17g0859631 [Helianthus annuus]|nr:hypothetical protein HanIR_Chr17g0859631 [Helianthus annuus]